MSMVPPEVASFVATASRLSGRTLDAIRWATATAVASGAYDQGAVPGLSAAEFSALNRQVRDAFAPRGEELRAGHPGGGLRSAIGCTTRTAQAIWKRERLTAGQYASLTEPFTVHGVPLPAGAP
ncbi:hypothetical protein [Streptomyces xanthophaeus]|uniref:hypothetical protein n=1 Tax=Streptomyces xanthophaeus TaxID=67385 RepID=UPI00233EEED1|nr:hypothetical protein [Streptomyces xanthophaeus]WCD87029.1 hypothetical protein KPP03845_103397 [Streptomyces xanthophaeus]